MSAVVALCHLVSWAPASPYAMAAGDSDDEVVGVVVGGFECDVVQAIEDHRREAADAIVHVDEGVVAHQRLQELRGPLPRSELAATDAPVGDACGWLGV
jgi:hypothetical protein